jgi:hypothetical protein
LPFPTGSQTQAVSPPSSLSLPYYSPFITFFFSHLSENMKLSLFFPSPLAKPFTSFPVLTVNTSSPKNLIDLLF